MAWIPSLPCWRSLHSHPVGDSNLLFGDTCNQFPWKQFLVNCSVVLTYNVNVIKLTSLIAHQATWTRNSISQRLGSARRWDKECARSASRIFSYSCHRTWKSCNSPFSADSNTLPSQRIKPLWPHILADTGSKSEWFLSQIESCVFCGLLDFSARMPWQVTPETQHQWTSRPTQSQAVNAAYTSGVVPAVSLRMV